MKTSSYTCMGHTCNYRHKDRCWVACCPSIASYRPISQHGPPPNPPFSVAPPPLAPYLLLPSSFTLLLLLLAPLSSSPSSSYTTHALLSLSPSSQLSQSQHPSFLLSPPSYPSFILLSCTIKERRLIVSRIHHVSFRSLDT